MKGGELLAACLQAQGVDRIFCVPGESYLALLDGLYGRDIDIVNARQEGGATMMADADGRLTGRPGVAMVTRGPGATNASSGVHIAQQDDTPMVLLVGQVARDMIGRDAFQEVDFKQFFGGMAKWVCEIDDANRIPEIIGRAFHVAMSGRPGPVVLSLPEDMLTDETDAVPGPRVEVEGPFCSSGQAEAAIALLARAERPMIIAGGGRWDENAIAALGTLAEKWGLPVGVTFRRQNLIESEHPNYAGDIALGINPALAERVRDADCVLLLGDRFSEVPSQSYTLFDIPQPKQTLIHIHPDASELGRIYTPTLCINATPGSFLEASLVHPASRDFSDLAKAAHESWLGWTGQLPPGAGKVTMSATIAHFRQAIGDNAVVANGAGNYAAWLNRFLYYRPGMQMAPTSGSMGYGLPAGIATALRRPEAETFVFAGDGCFQMTNQELAVAAERNLKLRVIVCDNSLYGTIRMHQEREFPGRQIATRIANPDFARLAESYGAAAFTVREDAEFPDAFAAARKADGTALVHLKLDPRDISPGRVLEK